MRCTVLVIVILSVRLSVRPSVTLVHCVHMVRPTIMISSPYGSPIILVSVDITYIKNVTSPETRMMELPYVEGSSQNSKGVIPRALNEDGVGTNWRFATNKSPYLQNGARYDKGYY